MSPENKKEGNSYGQILKSSSLIGGAQGISYVLAMVRVKLVAVLLGPSGVGLVGLYTTITSLISTISNLGLETSGVREVAGAHHSGNQALMASTVKTLFRFCWVVGLLGWLLTAVFSYPLSIWIFESSERALAIFLLGATVFLGAVNGGRTALIQGTRHIGDLARLNVLGAVASTVVAVGLYAWLGEQGILPVLIITAAINLGFASWFAHRIRVVRITQTWSETLRQSRRLMGIGAAFMFGGVTAAVVALGIRAVIVRNLGLEAGGVYQAAMALSGIFGNFILAAMGADFNPRLSASIDDKIKAVKLVNEQVEIGLLIALPGMLATLFFSTWLMKIFYSSAFLAGAELLPWLIIGVFLHMISAPLSYILVAKGSWQPYVILVTGFHLLFSLFSFILLPYFGLNGIVITNTVLFTVYLLALQIVVRNLIDFKWTKNTKKLILLSGFWMTFGLFVRWISPKEWIEIVGFIVIIGVGVFSLRGVALRLGKNHRAVSFLYQSRVWKFLCGL